MIALFNLDKRCFLVFNGSVIGIESNNRVGQNMVVDH
jgi:hypothetical protein